MRFRNYERPDGWSKGQPEVLVTKHVHSTLGEPLVNYDSLHQHLTDDLGIAYDQQTTIKLYGRYLTPGDRPRSSRGLLGFHTPYTKTVHANAFRAECGNTGRRGGVMHVISHEGRHLSDTANHRVRTAAELTAEAAAMLLVYKAAHYIPGPDPAPVLGLHFEGMAGLVAADGLWYKFISPLEKRANAEAASPAAIAHQQDILFPHSERTDFLEREGRLPEDTLQRLGRVIVPA